MESIVLYGLRLDAWITIATLVALMAVLAFTRLRSDVVFLGATSFEQDSGMTLVAVSRRGERICKAPREVVLQAGDTLLLIHPSPFGRTQLV